MVMQTDDSRKKLFLFDSLRLTPKPDISGWRFSIDETISAIKGLFLDVFEISGRDIMLSSFG